MICRATLGNEETTVTIAEEASSPIIFEPPTVAVGKLAEAAIARVIARAYGRGYRDGKAGR